MGTTPKPRPTPQRVLRDADFHSLPIEDRLSILGVIDPDFQALPGSDQRSIVEAAAAAASKQPQMTLPDLPGPRLPMPQEVDAPGAIEHFVLRPIDTFFRAANRGALGAVQGFGRATEQFGGYLERTAQQQGKQGYVGKAFKGVGEGVMEFAKRNTAPVAPHMQGIAGQSFIDKPELLLNPEYIIDLMGQGAGSSAAFAIPGFGAMSRASKLLEAAKLSKTVAAAAETAVGVGVGSFLETVSDAGMNYDEAIEMGASPETAAQVFRDTILKEFPTTAAFNAIGLYNPTTKGKLKTFLSAAAEGTQEVGQGVAQRSALNANVPGADEPLLRGADVEFLSGLLGGAVTGGVAAAYERAGWVPREESVEPEAITPPAPEVAPAPAPAPAAPAVTDEEYARAVAAVQAGTGKYANRNEVKNQTGLTRKQTQAAFDRMVDEGVLSKTGGKRGTFYQVVRQEAAPSTTVEESTTAVETPPEVQEAIHDREDQQGIPSQIREGQATLETQPFESRSSEEAPASGVLQTQEEVAPKTEQPPLAQAQAKQGRTQQEPESDIDLERRAVEARAAFREAMQRWQEVEDGAEVSDDELREITLGVHRAADEMDAAEAALSQKNPLLTPQPESKRKLPPVFVRPNARADLEIQSDNLGVWMENFENRSVEEDGQKAVDDARADLEQSIAESEALVERYGEDEALEEHSTLKARIQEARKLLSAPKAAPSAPPAPKQTPTEEPVKFTINYGGGKVGEFSVPATPAFPREGVIQQPTAAVPESAGQRGSGQAAPGVTPFNGGRVVESPTYISVHFDEKPPRDTLDKLKGAGFKWHSKDKSWRKWKTSGAKDDALKVVGEAAPKPEYSPVPEEGIDRTENKPTLEAGTDDARRGDEHVGPASPGPLEEVPPADEPGTGKPRPATRRSGSRGEVDQRPDEQPDRGVQDGPAGSVGDGEGGTGVPPGGAGQPAVRGGPTGVTRPRPGASRDFRLQPEHLADLGSNQERFKANLEAIRLLKRLEAEDRLPTEEEQRTLARYVGWGGLAQDAFGYRWQTKLLELQDELKELLTEEEYAAARASTTNAHYTTIPVIDAMWRALRRLGLEKGGKILEPAAGVGHFLGRQPASLLPAFRSASEMDSITGRILRKLYPDTNVHVLPYQEAPFPDGYFDVAISNVPFGKIKVVDRAFRAFPQVLSGIHNYFFAKALKQVRPGGVVAFITSRYTMDSQNSAVRSYLAKEARLLGAIRLPGGDTGAFAENAGTEVTTDIIFLQRRQAGVVPAEGEEQWVKTVRQTAPKEDGSQGEYNLNEYFVAHPEMMLGRMELSGSMYRAAEPVLKGELTTAALNAAVDRLPERVMGEPDTASPAFQEPLLVEAADRAIKEGGFGLKDGQLVVRQGNELVPAKVTETAKQRIVGLMGVRDAVNEVYRVQRESDDEAALKKAQKELNRKYDAFVKKFGFISNEANRAAFSQDPDYWMLLGIEDWDSRSKTATKREVFSKRTMPTLRPVERVETAKEALAVTLAERGKLDPGRMAQLTGKSEDAVLAELAEADLIYLDPEQGRWVAADEYLSGWVRHKLTVAREAAKHDPRMARNVEALERSQPVDVPPEAISVRLGAAWVPVEDVQEFARLALVSREYARGQLTIEHSDVSASWTVRVGEYVTTDPKNTNGWGDNFKGHELLELALNGKKPKVYTAAADGSKRRVIDRAATQRAEEAQERLEDQFNKWLWSDGARTVRLLRAYNEMFNGFRLREFDGSHLEFPGMAKGVLRRNDLDPHQKAGAWRIISSPGNTMLAHVVGAGKTYEMIAAGMEMKRMGMIRKPMYVVPNHLVEQWAQDFIRLYPGASIFVAGPETFHAGKRQHTAARIASGNYDAVIISHRSFEFLPVSDQTYQRFVDEEVAAIDAELERLRSAQREDSYGGGRKKSKKKGRTVKQLETRRQNLIASIEKRANRLAKDRTIDFENLGVDQLFVDEAHLFKNLGYTSSMERIAGLPNSNSNRSFDMLIKTRWLMERRGGKGVVFATGTPISNSLAEMYTMMRYLDPQSIKDAGLGEFDAWAAMFGRAVRSVEVAPEGGSFRIASRFVKFVNLPELIQRFRAFTDVKTADDLKLPRPKLRGDKPETIASPAHPLLQAFVLSLGDRAEMIRTGAIDPKDDNMLKVTHEGRMAALDVRLFRGPAMAAARGVSARLRDAADELASRKSAKVNYPDSMSEKERRKAEMEERSAIRLLERKVERLTELQKQVEPYLRNPALLDEAQDLKLHAVANKVAEIHKETAANRSTQAVFLDLSIPRETKKNQRGEEVAEEEGDEDESKPVAPDKMEASAYEELRRQLVARGVPAEEIRFMHEAKNNKQKQQLFDDVNRGVVRVILGSTSKMGAGSNIQKKLIALHHVDAPWRPADIEQREGRILRQGNENAEVRIFNYVTAGSFDAYMWQGVATKAKMIAAAMSGDMSMREVADASVQVLSAKETLALASGDATIQERLELEAAVGRLERKKFGVAQERAEHEGKLAAAKAAVPRLRQEYEDDRADAAVVAAWDAAHKEEREPHRLELVDGTPAPKGSDLLRLAKERTGVIGSYRGMPIRSDGEYVRLAGRKDYQHFRIETFEKMDNGGALILQEFGRSISPHASEYYLTEAKTRLRALEEIAPPVWSEKDEAELREAKSRLDELNRELGLFEDAAGGEETAEDEPEKPDKHPGGPVYLGSGIGALQELYEQWEARRRKPADTSGPITKKQIRKIRTVQRKLDLPDDTYRAKLLADYGVDSTTKLTKNQATEFLADLLSKDAGGELVNMPHLPWAAKYVRSPSMVLGRSEAGRKVYQAAEDAWFEQDDIDTRLSKWMRKANRGLSREQINRIGLYRDVRQLLDHYEDKEKVKRILKKAGENPDIADAVEADTFLDARLKMVNKRWTEIFEYTRRIGVEMGFLKPDQKIDSYLPFYYDSFFKAHPERLRDAAADLAQELGIDTKLATMILERSMPKNVKFGSFDMERLGWLLPGMRDPMQRWEIYRIGFARKVANTKFLKVANKQVPKIADISLRNYARAYVQNFIGRPPSRKNPVTRIIGTIPGLRHVQVTDGQLAGVLTAIQYTSKLGFNLWSAAVNLTQTPLNTFPVAGFRTTMSVLPRATAAVLLPMRLNPVVRDVIRLRQAGVLDSFSGKFERPHLHGVAERVQQAAGFLFEKTEALNRATAYLAGLEQARQMHLKGDDARRHARGVVRRTQFYSGRLDAPLWSRTPVGRVVMQFKTFTAKEVEFVFSLNRRQQAQFAFWSAAIGGPASLGLLAVFTAFWPDAWITKKMQEWQDTFNLAALLHAKRLSEQMGIFMVPGAEDLGTGRLKSRALEWGAGPSINAGLDTVQEIFSAIKDPEKSKLAATLIRSWAPGGVQAMRVSKALGARDAGEAARILTNTAPPTRRPRPLPPELR